ncbi:hypothetical protein [Rhodobacter maris]|uniref:Uncharacterized protein n=1 Tax=Rhodobacter maris TaxID=446682 RepID=A0A285SRS8_9RHOB|nr:hypothetical protein [Rhodobacter maris]SOC10951.1 hypothetical protein SAMN05877831_108134 [Rhodobacter maris]
MSSRFSILALSLGGGGIAALATITFAAEPRAIAPLPGALFAFGALALALALAALLRQRQIAARSQARGPHSAPCPAAAPPALAPAKHLAQGRGLDAEVKLRMTEVHRLLRARAPELLPVFADCRAAQMRLLSELRRAPAQRIQIEAELIGGLVQIETATRKLSLVLGSATNEHTLGNFADTLEKLTSETLDCLVSLRARSRGAQHGREIGGRAEHA